MIQKRDSGRCLAAYAARDGFAAKSHSTTTQYRQLRRLGTARNVNLKVIYFLTIFLASQEYVSSVS